MIEETPSLWKEFVWPYYDSCEVCRMKRVLRVYGQHIKVFSIPNSRVPSTLVEMLQYCCNVQHLSLPSTKLDPKQVRNVIYHLRCLQKLELRVNNHSDVKQLLLCTCQLKELTIILDTTYNFYKLKDLFENYMLAELRPPNINVTVKIREYFMNYFTSQPITISTGTITTTNFRVYYKYDKVPLYFSFTFPYFQLQVGGSGKVTTPCVKLSDFGILGLSNDVAVMTDCQIGGKTKCMVRYQNNNVTVNNYLYFTNLSCVAYFDLTRCFSLHSGHLEQIAIVCPNLQRLNLQNCSHCLKKLQGLRAIASHCHYLQGLNLLGIHVSNVENHILLWEILISDMKLTHVGVEFSVLNSKAIRLICLYQNCWTIKGIQCGDNWYENFTKEDAFEIPMLLSCFPSLYYCYLSYCELPPSTVQDVINNCKELRCASFSHLDLFLLNVTHIRNLQQLHICSPHTDVPDDFMTSVSSHGGLVHVVLSVRSLTIEGIKSLVKNSPNLMTLYLYAISHLENCHATLKKEFWNKRLFTVGYCKIEHYWDEDLRDVLYQKGTDLFPIW